MSKNLYEELEKICSNLEPGKPTLVEKLSKAMATIQPLRELLRMNFQPNFIGFELPEGMPPLRKEHKQMPYGYGDASLMMEVKHLYLFVNGFVKLTKKQKETRFIELLEALHWREAELLVAVKDRKLEELFPLINSLVISDLAPDIIPPLTFEDGIVAAVYRKPKNQGIHETISANLVYKVYTPQELLDHSYHGNIVFKYPEQATEENGLNVLLPGYVAPNGEKVVIPTTKTKQGRHKKPVDENAPPKVKGKAGRPKKPVDENAPPKAPGQRGRPRKVVDI